MSSQCQNCNGWGVVEQFLSLGLLNWVIDDSFKFLPKEERKQKREELARDYPLQYKFKAAICPKCDGSGEQKVPSS